MPASAIIRQRLLVSGDRRSEAAYLPVEQPAKFEPIDMTNRWRFAYSNALPAGGWSISDVWVIDA
jgi:hypothetical protein